MELQSENINELMAALSQAQGEIKNAVKDSNNPFFKSKYADLASIKEACQTALTTHGIAVVQATNILENGTLVLVTTLGHASGQWMKGIYPLNPVKNDPQGMGSAVTYARRYTLAAMVGVISDDDDGEAAQGRTHTEGPRTVNLPFTGKVSTLELHDTYNATPEHKKVLVEKAREAGIDIKDKDLLKRINDEFVINKIKMSDISAYLTEVK